MLHSGLAFIWVASQDTSQAEILSEVTMWLESGQAVATSTLSGRREIPLGAQEVVVGSGTNGRRRHHPKGLTSHSHARCD